MPKYYLATSDNDGSQSPDDPFGLPDDKTAIQQARKALAEMAVDGLPKDAAHPFAVRVYAQSRPDCGTAPRI
jgi:hypothetical protein